jgi:glycine oxidase
MKQKSVIVVGGGIIGMSLGWELARQGCSVTVVERGEAGREASWLAAGMLAADAEVGFEELDLYRVSRESLRRWPAFAKRLESESGVGVDYRGDGTLVVADDRDSAEALRRMYEFQLAQGIEVRWLSGAEALDLEPFLSPRLSAAVLAHADHQVDNRRVMKALTAAFERARGTLLEHAQVTAVVPHADRPGVDIRGADPISADVVVLAAGAWSRSIEGIEPEMLPPVRPIKGQILELKVEAPFDLNYVVRGPRAYLAPKQDGRVIVGATAEDMGFDTRVTAGGVYSILEGAWEIVPGIYDLEILDVRAGLRPGTRDNEPIVGWSGLPGVYYATGHYRHGILHAAITAEEVGRELTTGTRSEWLEAFRPARFQQGVAVS